MPAKRNKDNVSKPKPTMKDRGNLTEEARQYFIRRAQAEYHDEGTCEVDDDALVSYVSPSRGGQGGAYVQAWVWVSSDDEALRE